MSCIDPKNEFNTTGGYTPPVYCPGSKNTTTKTNTGCSMWDGAVGAMQNDSTNLSGNWYTPLSQCYRIQSNQVLTYGKGNVFDIQQLRNGWTGGPMEDGSTQCVRSLYGAFLANGCRAGSNDDPTKCATDTNTSVYDYWQQMKQTCKTTLASIDNHQNLGSGPGSYTDAFKGFTLDSGTDGSSRINFQFDCVDPKVSMYTQCKRPGWDMMGTDASKGWVGSSICSQNPLYQHQKTPISCASTTTNTSLVEDDKCGTDGYVACGTDTSKPDLRPRDPNGDGCCLNCTDWNSDSGYKTYFSHQEATDTTYPAPTSDSTSLNDFFTDQCEHNNGKGCCIKKPPDSDTIQDDICKTCQTLNSSNKYDMSSAKVTVYDNNNAVATQLPYVDGTDSTGKKMKGIAITPTAGTNPATIFNDPRDCLGGKKYAGQCQGMTGCAGVDPYCLGSWDACEHNACNAGLSYTGTDQTYANPATNCPNLYTLARSTTYPSCPTDSNFDTDIPQLAANMDKIEIPEGAWVTGYIAKSEGGNWNDNGGICAVPNAQYAIMMGCGQKTQSGGSSKLEAYASDFELTSDGEYKVLKGSNTTTLPNGNTLYVSDNVKSTANTKTCTFTGLHNNNLGVVGGFTFGFMPGYYNPDYKTSTGPCD